MKIAPVAEMTTRFRAYLKASEEGPVVVTKKGKAVAVLLSIEDDDELERLILAYSPKFQAILNKSMKSVQKTGGIRHEDFWREVEAEAQQTSNPQ